MKRLLLIAAFLATPAHAQVVTLEEISSKTARAGDPVAVTEGSAIILHVQKRSTRARDGVVTIRYTTASGETGVFTQKGKSGPVLDAISFGLTGLLVKGKHAIIPAGTVLDADLPKENQG